MAFLPPGALPKISGEGLMSVALLSFFSTWNSFVAVCGFLVDPRVPVRGAMALGALVRDLDFGS